MLLALMSAANYIDIPSLLDVACAKFVATMKGKTPEEIRAIYGFVNDFTPEEEARVRAENEWCKGVN